MTRVALFLIGAGVCLEGAAFAMNGMWWVWIGFGPAIAALAAAAAAGKRKT